MVRILDTDTAYEIAKKIWNEFDLLQSCHVIGFFTNPGDQVVIDKGEMVVSTLKMLDEAENIRFGPNGKRYRIYKQKPNSVGGPIAHKIFTWERRIVNNEPRYTIWRVQ